jgi:hypothetical protein
MRPRELVTVGAAVLLTTALAPAAASASIVPGESIAGVKLHMLKDTVRAKLGKPGNVATQPAQHVERWDYPRRDHLTVTFYRGRVDWVFVTVVPAKARRIDLTSKGIGLNSRFSAADAAYPGHCYFDKTYPPSCNWTKPKQWMLFKASGRYGKGPSTPIETIELAYRTPHGH